MTTAVLGWLLVAEAATSSFWSGFTVAGTRRSKRHGQSPIAQSKWCHSFSVICNAKSRFHLLSDNSLHEFHYQSSKLHTFIWTGGVYVVFATVPSSVTKWSTNRSTGRLTAGFNRNWWDWHVVTRLNLEQTIGLSYMNRFLLFTSAGKTESKLAITFRMPVKKSTSCL